MNEEELVRFLVHELLTSDLWFTTSAQVQSYRGSHISVTMVKH